MFCRMGATRPVATLSHFHTATQNTDASGATREVGTNASQAGWTGLCRMDPESLRVIQHRLGDLNHRRSQDDDEDRREDEKERGKEDLRPSLLSHLLGLLLPSEA